MAFAKQRALTLPSLSRRGPPSPKGRGRIGQGRRLQRSLSPLGEGQGEGGLVCDGSIPYSTFSPAGASRTLGKSSPNPSSSARP